MKNKRCNFCSKCFQSENDLKKHLMKIHNATELQNDNAKDPIRLYHFASEDSDIKVCDEPENDMKELFEDE